MPGASYDCITRFELETIVKIAKAKIAYESRIARILRTISEALNFGKYCNSSAGKLKNLRMSQGAIDLMRELGRGNKEEFLRNTVLEHQEPLSDVYKRLLNLGPDLTIDRAAEIIGQFRLVTVTKSEDRRLRDCKDLEAAARYEKAGIIVCDNVENIFSSRPSFARDQVEVSSSQDDDPSQLANGFRDGFVGWAKPTVARMRV
jgi:hypothetical protein